MKVTKGGYRIAVVGASSLLGKELLNVLEEHHFPFSRLLTFSDDQDDLELPILDLSDVPKLPASEEQVTASELDFAFIAARYPQMPSFLNTAQTAGQGGSGCFIIDLSALASGAEAAETQVAFSPGVVSIPFLDRRFPRGDKEPVGDNRFYISASPASIVISGILLRLATSFPLKGAVASIFASVSEIGSHGIEELQKQTLNLLSLQKIPRKVFGEQLAFNLLSRPGGMGGSKLLAL